MVKRPPTPDNKYKTDKIRKIKACLQKKEVDLWLLRELSLSKGGLINADLRRKSWHKLLGINRVDMDNTLFSAFGQISSFHNGRVTDDDLDLVERDVGRSVFFRYWDSPKRTAKAPQSDDDESLESDFENTFQSTYQNDFQNKNSNIVSARDILENPENISKPEQEQMLLRLITSAIAGTSAPTSSIPEKQSMSLIQTHLRYYQGFHDIASVVLLNLPNNPQQASAILRSIAKSHLTDAMQDDFSKVTNLLEIVFYPLLQCFDEELHDFLVLCELSPSVFLTWIVTLFAHQVHNPETASRFMDCFIASHHLMPLYLSMAVMVNIENRMQILAVDSDDPSMVHMVVTSLLKNVKDDFDDCNGDGGFTCQDLIDDAISFMTKVPPDNLLKFAKSYDLGQNKVLLSQADSIHSFNSPPSYALAARAPSDYVQQKEKKAASTKNLRSLKKASITNKTGVTSAKKNTVPMRENSDKYINAIIASGIKGLMKTVNISSRKTKKSFISKSTLGGNIFSMIKQVFGMKHPIRRKRLSVSVH